MWYSLKRATQLIYRPLWHVVSAAFYSTHLGLCKRQDGWITSPVYLLHIGLMTRSMTRIQCRQKAKELVCGLGIVGIVCCIGTMVFLFNPGTSKHLSELKKVRVRGNTHMLKVLSGCCLWFRLLTSEQSGCVSLGLPHFSWWYCVATAITPV